MSRDAAVYIIERLRRHGHVAVLAGGCVRDRLLGLTPHDHDVATDAPPEAVQQLFKRSQPVGEAFGVVLVYPPRNLRRNEHGEKSTPGAGGVEVATFRTEGVYSDGRRPDDVAFSDIEHDAQRRDFTINGLFEDPGELKDSPLLAGDRSSPLPPPTTRTLDDGSVILDYVGGLADLESKTLRAIGDPARRFAEDYLRMLRAVRFTARLGFTLDPATADAIRAHAPKLDQIARERIGDEVRAAITGPRPHLAATLLQQLYLDAPTLRENANDPPLPTLERLALDAGYPAALAAWLFDRRSTGVPQPADVAQWRSALCLSNDETDTLGRILRQVRTAADWPTLAVAKRKRLLASLDWEATLAVLHALDRADAIEADTPALRDDSIGLAPEPLVDGGDLIRLGLKPGPAFKTLLDDAYDAQLEGRVTTQDEALDWVRQHAERS